MCHEHVDDVEDIKKCSCKRLAKARYEYFNYGKDKPELRNGIGNMHDLLHKEDPKEGLRKRKKSVQDGEHGRGETAKV